jgi:hypothetical protein
MADEFLLVEPPAAHGEGPGLAPGDAGAGATGARQLGAEGVGLPFEQHFEGPLVEARRGRLRDLFHGVEIEFERGGVVAARASGDDSSPLGGEFVELAELGRGEGFSRHDGSRLGVRTRTAVKMLPSM